MPSSTLLSSDEVVRAISGHLQHVSVVGLKGQMGLSGVLNVDLVDSATGKIIKSVSSLEDAVSLLSDNIRSDRTLPVGLLQFVNTPFGSTILNVILTAAVAVGVLLYQEHREDLREEQSEAKRKQFEEERQHRTEQFIRQMAQSVERDLLSHSEQPTTTPRPNTPQGD